MSAETILFSIATIALWEVGKFLAGLIVSWLNRRGAGQEDFKRWLSR